MKDEVYNGLTKNLVKAEDSKDAFNYAKALSELIKAEAEQTRVDMAAIDQANRTEIERTKVEAEIEATSKKIENERIKIENERMANEKRSENDRERIESDERAQRYRADRTSKDNKIMSGALLTAYAITFGMELKGIMVTKNLGSIRSLIRFLR